MKPIEQSPDRPAPSDVETRRLEPSDAASLSRCFERCYAESYPHGDFYDTEALAERVRRGDLRSVVAVTAGGEVVGHTGLVRRHPDANVVEAGNTIVDPSHRGSGVLRLLGTALVERCREEGYAGFIHYPTTAHDVMQKTSVRFGGVETGVLLAYVPEETDYREVEIDQPAGRLAVTVVYQPIGELSESEVVLPERHETLLEQLYSELQAPRGRRRPQQPSGPSVLAVSHSTGEGVLRLSIDRVGDDLAAVIDGHPPERTAAAVTHADLSLADPGAEHAAELLSGRGFRFGALLPEFATGDLLRLQRLNDPNAIPTPRLANAGARRLYGYITGEQPG